MSKIPTTHPFYEEDFRPIFTASERKSPHQIERDAKIQAARELVSTPEDVLRRRNEMQRFQAALDTMPHPPEGSPRPRRSRSLWTSRSPLRPVGNYVFEALTTEERAHLSRMMMLADGEREDLSGWHDSLGNCGISAGSGRVGPPTENEMRELCEDLGAYRTDMLCDAGTWGSLTEGFYCARERVSALYLEASGISNEMLWGLKESRRAHEAARAVIEEMNDRRDALIAAGMVVPRAHVVAERWYPTPKPLDVQLALPTLGKHIGSPEA